MTYHLITFHKAALITSTALSLVPLTPVNALAQSSPETIEPPIATTTEQQSADTIALQAQDRTADTSSTIAETQKRTATANTPVDTSDIEPAAGKRAPDELDQIVVTGTSIRGIGASAGTEPIILDAETITASGYTTVHQALRTLPQVFGGGVSETVRSGQLASFNVTASTSPNLRGLGPKATLTLVNGRRLPSVSMDTSSVDVSSLPLSIIERIEVLPDGASAIYGADAVAGVINIILKKKYDGLDTTFRYGTIADSDAQEINASQVIGRSWENGGIVLAYEFYRRGNLHHTERSFSASDDLRPFGGQDHRSFFSTPGNIIDMATFTPAFAIPTGQDGTSLTPDDLLPGSQAQLSSRLARRDLLPRQKRHSIYLNANQEITDNLTAHAEARYGKRNVRNYSGNAPNFLFVMPSHPFYVDAFGNGSPLLVAYDFSRDLPPVTDFSQINSYNFMLGADYSFDNELTLRTYTSYSQEKTNTDRLNSPWFTLMQQALLSTDPNRVLNIFGDGGDISPETLQFITPPHTVKTNFRITEINSILDGSLFQTPGGDLRFAVGGNFRDERASSADTRSILGPSKFERTVYAAFSELFWPIFSAENRRAGIENLSFSASIRFEEYKDKPILPKPRISEKQSTINPKFGTRWEVIPGFELRGTYGTSFATPSLADRIASTYVSTFPVTDPRAPSGTSYALFLDGIAPDLENEKATTWTGGITIAPPRWSGLRISASYYEIKFKNRIVPSQFTLDMLTRENDFPGVITRSPSAEQVLAACRQAENSSDLPDACTTPALAQLIIDNRTRNQAVSTIRGIDGQLNVPLQINQHNQLLFTANASYLFENDFQLTRSSPATSNLNTLGNPIDFQWRIGSTWTNQSGYSATIFVNYQDDYKLTQSDPRRIGSFTTIDTSLSYQMNDQTRAPLLRNLTLTLACVNIFDKDPPLADTPGGYDPSNANPLGRYISLTISKKW